MVFLRLVHGPQAHKLAARVSNVFNNNKFEARPGYSAARFPFPLPFVRCKHSRQSQLTSDSPSFSHGISPSRIASISQRSCYALCDANVRKSHLCAPALGAPATTKWQNKFHNFLTFLCTLENYCNLFACALFSIYGRCISRSWMDRTKMDFRRA